MTDNEKFISRWGDSELDDHHYLHIPGWVLRHLNKFTNVGVSIKNGDKAVFSKDIGKISEITPSEYMFMSFVMSFKFDGVNGNAAPDLNDIALMMSRERNAIQKIKQSLVDKGALTVTYRNGKTSIYDFSELIRQCRLWENFLYPLSEDGTNRGIKNYTPEEIEKWRCIKIYTSGCIKNYTRNIISINIKIDNQRLSTSQQSFEENIPKMQEELNVWSKFNFCLTNNETMLLDNNKVFVISESVAEEKDNAKSVILDKDKNSPVDLEYLLPNGQKRIIAKQLPKARKPRTTKQETLNKRQELINWVNSLLEDFNLTPDFKGSSEQWKNGGYGMYIRYAGEIKTLAEKEIVNFPELTWDENIFSELRKYAETKKNITMANSTPAVYVRHWLDFVKHRTENLVKEKESEEKIKGIVERMKKAQEKQKL